MSMAFVGGGPGNWHRGVGQRDSFPYCLLYDGTRKCVFKPSHGIIIKLPEE